MTVSWRAIIIGVAAMAVSLWLLALWLPGWLAPVPSGSAASDAAAPPAGTAETDARRIHALLFYVASSGDALVGIDREVPYAPSPAAQARAIVEAQLAAPPPGHVSAVPAGASVRALFLTGRGEAFIDLSSELASQHPGGSTAEALTVYAIVHALTVNLPDISSVQILINGREVDTLAGHLDLRHPLKRDARWIAQ